MLPRATRQHWRMPSTFRCAPRRFVGGHAIRCVWHAACSVVEAPRRGSSFEPDAVGRQRFALVTKEICHDFDP
jgi:hypothetical protein